MTERLYYIDPQMREFDATVVRVDRRDNRTLIRLDRTCFYPTSGGQPFDTGTLGGLKVVDVIDDDDGDIVHVVEGIAETGRSVHGAIDWERRFDHMQQHSGQHLLSAAFDRLYGVRTVSFHLGAEASTIDLAREMTVHEIAAAENEANRIVWEDRSVTIRFASAEEAVQLPLRKESIREGTLRLIEVDQFDLSACGGTHVPGTGAVGTIVVSAWERFKGGQRIEFLCGARTLARFRVLRDAAAAGARLLSVGPGELAGSIERLQAETKDQRRALVALQNDLCRYKAEELAASAESMAAGSNGRVVVHLLDLDANGLKSVASAITSRPGFVVLLASNSTPSTPSLVVIARSKDVDLPANEILNALTLKFGGRGGGKADLAQGGGLGAPPQDILAAGRALISAKARRV